jgi:Fe-S-cluster containining protein
MSDVPFTRTVCACDGCKACCKRQPGHLIPGDVERIAGFLRAINDPIPVRDYLWDSPGAITRNSLTGVERRVRTITPRFKDGRCVFLDDEEWCRIHPVAPYGCAYFDTHLNLGEAMRRSVWGVRRIDGDENYRLIRGGLPLAGHYKPTR